MAPAGFVKVGPLAAFPDGRGRAVSVAGERVAVFRRGLRVWAMRDACPHMGASLAEGRLEGPRVVCHWHGWSFDLSTGQGDARAWACARTWQVSVEDGEVWLRPPDPEPEPVAPEDDPWVPFDPEQHLRGG